PLLRLVVVALDQPRAVLVAHALVLRRVELHVVHVLALRAGAPPRQPPHDLVVRRVDPQHGGERAPARAMTCTSVSSWLRPSSRRSSISAWPMVRGKSSRRKPLSASPESNRDGITSQISSSGTSSPCSLSSLHFSP